MKKSRAKVGKVTPKSSNRSQGEEMLSLSWLMEDLVSEVAGEIEAFSAQIGLHIMQAEMEHEVSEKVGVWGQECPHSVLLLNPDPDLSPPKLIPNSPPHLSTIPSFPPSPSLIPNS